MCIVDHQAGRLELDGTGSLGCNGSTFPHMICHSPASYFGLDLIARSETQNRKEKRTILFSAFTCLRFPFYLDQHKSCDHAQCQRWRMSLDYRASSTDTDQQLNMAIMQSAALWSF